MRREHIFLSFVTAVAVAAAANDTNWIEFKPLDSIVFPLCVMHRVPCDAMWCAVMTNNTNIIRGVVVVVVEWNLYLILIST